MRFLTPDNYSVIFQGQIVHSVGGVIETDNKALIESLSENQRVTPEKSQPAKQKAKGEGA